MSHFSYALFIFHVMCCGRSFGLVWSSFCFSSPENWKGDGSFLAGRNLLMAIWFSA